MAITFSRLRETDDKGDQLWGLRGDKDSPTDAPPQEGTTVVVTKKSGEEQDVIMGSVVVQGPDYWLARTGATNNTNVCRACMCESCVAIATQIRELLGLGGTTAAPVPERTDQEMTDDDEAAEAVSGDQDANPWED